MVGLKVYLSVTLNVLVNSLSFLDLAKLILK